MVNYIYGSFSDAQIKKTAQMMHGEIHKLLLYKDPKVLDEIFPTSEIFEAYFKNLFYKYNGLNHLLGFPEYMVQFLSILEAAYIEHKSSNYCFYSFRKLIFDAHDCLTKLFGEVRNAKY